MRPNTHAASRDMCSALVTICTDMGFRDIFYRLLADFAVVGSRLSAKGRSAFLWTSSTTVSGLERLVVWSN